jgi:hemoglobin
VPSIDPEQVASMHDRVGGDAWFVALVDRFYATVGSDPLLRPLYPDDLTDSKAHMAGFLIQYWGGPTSYSDQRGHPRLRMRHAPFVIGPAERDAWYDAMAGAVRGGGLGADDEAAFLAYFEMAATAMINHPDGTPGGSPT